MLGKLQVLVLASADGEREVELALRVQGEGQITEDFTFRGV